MFSNIYFPPIAIYFRLNTFFNLLKNPFSSLGIVTSMFFSKILLAASTYALPDGAFFISNNWFSFICLSYNKFIVRNYSIKSIDNKSTISSTSIISPFLTMFGLNLFITNSGFFISDASNNPIILSASLIEEISAVVTTIALSAPAIAF